MDLPETLRQPPTQPQPQMETTTTKPSGTDTLGANRVPEDDRLASGSNAATLKARSPTLPSSSPVPLPSTSMSIMYQEIGTLDTYREQIINPPSRPRTPRAKVKTPKPMTPQTAVNLALDGAQLLGPAIPRSPDSNRPLNVTDALSYLDAVKVQFQDKPDVYNHFLDIMKDFKSQVIDTPGVIERVSMLFHGNPYLIQGFNTFLPPGYRIDLSSDPRNLNAIMVTTPMGTITQSTNPFGTSMRPRDALLQGNLISLLPTQSPFGGSGPPPILPVGLGPGSRPTTPFNNMLSHAPPFLDAPQPYSPVPHGGIQANQTNAAASFLNGLGGSKITERSTAGEFNHAIQYLNKIKTRFVDEPDVYKQFLEILQTYQKEQKQLHESQVFAQVARMFKDAPDLMEEFKAFLPEALGTSMHPPAGLIGIMPHPPPAPSSPGIWDNAETPPTMSEKLTKVPNRRRKRASDKESVVPPSKTGGSRIVKKAKHGHNKPDADVAPFAPYHHAHSPSSVHGHPHQIPDPPQQNLPPGHAVQPGNPLLNGVPAPLSSQEELLFFERTKKELESEGTYDEFLKLLNMFAMDVIDTRTLLEQASYFLTDGELMTQFKELMGWDDKLGHKEYGPPGSIRTCAPDPQAPSCPEDDQGPSYRRLPDYETRLACSGRGQLAWSVLNDEWISHPTWASEESGFIAHKKNQFEDTLHRSEEERHEYQTHIDAITRTVALLDPLEARIEEMSSEERAQFKLGPELGGWSPAIYYKILKKVYGQAAGEVYEALQSSPSVAVPVVLARLKQKNEDWRRLQREFGRTWREVEAKNFYKSLDYQGITFKANDKKNTTSKAFVQDIESIKAAQVKAKGRKAGGSSRPIAASCQLEYEFQDMDVLHDTLKLVYSFLDHSVSISQWSSSERRGIEQFLRSFLPTLFMFPPQELNAACGPLQPSHEDDSATDAIQERVDNGTNAVRDVSGQRSVGGGHSEGVPAGALRKRLLKTAQQNSPRRSAEELRSRSASPADSPMISSRLANDGEVAPHQDDRSNPEDVWIKQIPLVPRDGNVDAGTMPASKRPFFAGTTFYTLLRLIQVLYSRLLICKEIGAQAAKEKHTSLFANPVAVELGLDEPNGPAAVLHQAVDEIGGAASDQPNILYMYLLDASEKLFANEMDQNTFEEHMRWFFGTHAYHLYTLDKLIALVIKQVQTVLNDNKSQELWDLLQESRQKENMTLGSIVRYRRNAECHVGTDDHLYRIDCEMHERSARTLRVQLLNANDASAAEDDSSTGRWREYVTTYVMRHPTEWMPRLRAEKGKRGPLYLKRNLMDEDGERHDRNELGLCIRVSLGTYKLFYGVDEEDVFVRRRRVEEERALRVRAVRREEERRRSRWLK